MLKVKRLRKYLRIKGSKVVKSMWNILLFYLLVQVNLWAYGDSFSCNYGKRPACLDYGDKICSSYAKCVSSDAVCFNSYTCDYNGFICKSKFNTLANEYDDLVNKYNALINKYDNIVNDYNILLRKYKNIESDYEDLHSCISYASILEEAKKCY